MLTERERRDLFISWLTLTLAFAWDFHLSIFLSVLPIYAVAVFTGFVLHELAHKYEAIRLGYWAEYRMWESGLLLALLLSLLTGGRFIFAAPGAVYILGYPIPPDKNGKIALAGPLANLLFGFLFLLLTPYFSPLYYIARVNFFLAAFNLLPFYPLDGAKVFVWSKNVWLLVFLPSLFLSLFLPSLPL